MLGITIHSITNTRLNLYTNNFSDSRNRLKVVKYLVNKGIKTKKYKLNKVYIIEGMSMGNAKNSFNISRVSSCGNGICGFGCWYTTI